MKFKKFKTSLYTLIQFSFLILGVVLAHFLSDHTNFLVKYCPLYGDNRIN